MAMLEFKFPAGRYHATPTGHHVNEGQIEWPPSPWRIVRALIAVGFTTQHWDEIPNTGRRLFEKLTAILPSYKLPDASAAHSRHYMPIGTLKNNREQTTLVFDTWANVCDGILMVHWDCELSPDEADLLSRLANCLNYLGRSESWVEVRTIEEHSVRFDQFDAYPHDAQREPNSRHEQIALIAATAPDVFEQWRDAETAEALADFPLPESKTKPPVSLLKKRAKAIEPFPADLLDSLTKDTSWWKQHRWSQPPGSRRVVYWRPANALGVSIPPKPKPQQAKPINVFLLALTTPTGNKSSLPRVERTLPQAERLHRQFVGLAAKGGKIDCPELTGRDRDGHALGGQHEHAHILPVDLDCDGHLDHVIVFAQCGFSSVAQRAIAAVKRTWMKGGAGELQVAIAGRFDLNSAQSIRLEHQVAESGYLLMGNSVSRTWSSVTPFVPPRYVKRSGKNCLTGQVLAELKSRGLPVAKVEVLSEESIAFRNFVRRRGERHLDPPVDAGYFLRLNFNEPLGGPVCLGYASHFGLGLFCSG